MIQYNGRVDFGLTTSMIVTEDKDKPDHHKSIQPSLFIQFIFSFPLNFEPTVTDEDAEAADTVTMEATTGRPRREVSKPRYLVDYV